jgi:hypothetical protein
VGYTTINLGLTLTVPTSGTRNWGQNVLTGSWNKISSHDHSGAGNGNPIPTAGIADDSITTAKLAANFGVTVAPTLLPSGASPTQTVNLNLGMIQTVDLGSASGTVTLSLTNPQEGGIYKIFIIQAATPAGISVTSVKWPQGQTPILTETNDAIDCITLIYANGVYYGDWQLNWS